MRILLACLIIFCVISSLPAYAQTVYVTDSLKITMRSGPDTGRKIVKMLPSGSRLRILDQTSSWYRVQAEDGQTGWVLKRYTMQETPKKILIAGLEDKISGLQKSFSQAQKTIDRLRADNTDLSTALNTARSKLAEVSQDHQALRAKVHSLRSGQQLRWFLAGAGVIGLSALIGFIFGRFRNRQPASSRRVYF